MKLRHACHSLFLVLLLVPVSARALQPDTSPGWHDLSLQHDRLERHFRYFIPTNLATHPDLVLLFHGGTQSMRKIFRKRAGGSQEWEHLASENGFLLLTPNGVNLRNGDTEGDRQNWNDCRVAVEGDNSASTADDIGFVRALIDWAKVQFDINESRVYTTGASNGGLMSLRLVTELSDRIAAAAVFIANQPVESDCIAPLHPVPLFMMSGTEDPLMLWDGGQIRDKGPVMMSAPATRDFWLAVNHADKTRVKTELLPDVDNINSSAIIRSIYPAQPGGQPLWFYEVRGGGHTMPSMKYDVPFLARVLVGNQNRDLEGTHEAWTFLRQFTKE
ncbi:MAG: hypothetical protein WBN96_10900 [Gammaproteobacteria bacterium]